MAKKNKFYTQQNLRSILRATDAVESIRGDVNAINDEIAHHKKELKTLSKHFSKENAKLVKLTKKFKDYKLNPGVEYDQWNVPRELRKKIGKHNERARKAKQKNVQNTSSQVREPSVYGDVHGDL